VKILLLTTVEGRDRTEALPALDLLPHAVRCAVRDAPTAVGDGPSPDVVLVDARTQLAEAKGTCRMLRSTGLSVALVAVVTEPGLVAVSADWCLDDVILGTAGPAEVDARLRLAVGRLAVTDRADANATGSGDLVIDSDTYAVRLRGAPLSLTYKEFELLKYLAQHPGRVFTREQLLREVWGYDYFGGTRTVDVHVRRLRAKLGPSHEAMIGTVRQVGYKFVTQPAQTAAAPGPAGIAMPALPQAEQSSTPRIADHTRIS
jgi:DNA-binding response OmpR family regulator